MPFDPSTHVIMLPRRMKDPADGKWKTMPEPYLEVRWRLVWFRDKYPHGAIETEEVCVDLDRVVTIETEFYNDETHRREKSTKSGTGYARFKTTVRDGEGGVSTGYGTENAAEFADFVERAETRSIGRALAGLGIGTQFVGEEMGERLALAGEAQDDTEAPVKTVQTPVAEAPVIQAPHEVLGRKPIEKLNQQECVFRLQDELKRLTGTGQDPTSKQERKDLVMAIFGTGVDSFVKATQQGKSTLQRGLVKLEAMRPDVPPPATIEEDVPDFPPSPEHTQEGPSSPPGSTIPAGPSHTPRDPQNGAPDPFCIVVQEGTGVRCTREAFHVGAHYFAPPRPETRAHEAIRDADITPPDGPTLVDGYCTVGDARILRMWAGMYEQYAVYDELTAFVPKAGGEPQISGRLWGVIVQTVTMGAERAARG